MALSDSQLLNLNTNFVTEVLLKNNGLDNDYYLKPLEYIEKELGMVLVCNGMEFKNAVEIAHDEDIAPHDASMEVIVDGVLACIFSDYLEAAGLDLISYFTYRFTPPSPEFQKNLDKFEDLVNTHKVKVAE
jgi:hypothetical protein